jgi:DegV family protein with EDD domain
MIDPARPMEAIAAAGSEAPVGGITYLDGARLRRAMRAGIARLLEGQDHLNKINVFPIADGDTGTNMALTMHSVLLALQGSSEPHAGRTLGSIADAALDGARGNSGAILAQFFQGLSDASIDRSRLAPEDLATALAQGAQCAHEALSEPREGTVLCVLRDFAHEVQCRVNAGARDFGDLLGEGLLRARDSLARTPERLEALRRAGVVDAGAEGFVLLLTGMHRLVSAGSLREAETALPQALPHDTQAFTFNHGEETHRYCTECMVTGTDIDRRRLREELAALGSSLVLAGTHSKCKIHIHVDEPQRVFRLASNYGLVSGEKADDMFRQQANAHHQAAQRVAVITDSAADIPDEEFERLNLQMVPVRVMFGQRSYLDKVSLSNAEFFRELVENPHHPTTSQPAPGDFRRLYEFLASHYEEVVSINLSQRLSGTLQAARSAASRMEPRGRVHVMDSRSVSLGQGLVVMHAARCAQAGMDASQVLAEAERVAADTCCFGLLRNLDFAVRGGRVPRSRKVIADLLRITPVLSTTSDGLVMANGVILGRRRALPKFVEYVLRRIDTQRTWRVSVGHAQDPVGAEFLAEAFARRLPRLAELYRCELGSAFGVHGGPGTLVVAFQGADQNAAS